MILAHLRWRVLPAAQLAFHLEMSALLQRASELGELLAEDHATVPFGVRDVLAVLFVGALGCQRESGEAAVVVGANFCVVAEEADEGDFVLVHGGDLRFVVFPVSCSGHIHNVSEWARLPSAKECFLGGARKKFVRRFCRAFTNFFWEEPGKQNDAVPQGAGLAPKP